MKWVNGYIYAEKDKRKRAYLENWHKSFALFPVVVDITKDNRQVKVWLSYVERKGKYHWGYGDYWTWKYREIA